MIIERTKNLNDLKACADIWLEASTAAHSFAAPDFWASKHAAMLEEYLPASEVYIATEQSEIKGFAAIHGGALAALFIAPAKWGKGIGSKLLREVKARHTVLELAVYKSNTRAVKFYCKHGFLVQSEQICQHTNEPELLMRWHKDRPAPDRR